ncbi:MAG TPA: Hsp20/alpha crystallin family protein [Candidatus Mediterraneibacter stercoravium]|uniref:Hsp20/alpha crystallin family protein n=1 Tax=Candidatus Mediterraneibacter stercoravium TaxID=2838685 RepID=A0A9D2G9J5_9FIRM|nr:Hsp20/alpha crystallin family protein [Candidatus Mediterraneibacter stercoravium]
MLMPSIFGENLFDDDWFDFDRDFWGRKNPLYGKNAKNIMKTDIREHDAGYELDIDLPGFKKDEINVELENGYLTISAAKGLDKDEQDKKGKYIRKERYAGAMQRSFYVGDAVTEEDIKAKFEDGILKLSIPKKDAKAVETKKSIAIEG